VVLLDAEGEPLPAVEIAARALALESAANARRETKRRAREKLILKLREGAFEGRRKAIETQKANERTVYAMILCKLSVASQNRVRAEEEFEEVSLTLDSVRLWEIIRRTHLTHIFGETRFAALRQGDREYISTFKHRFDNQIRANEGAGVPEITDSKLALEFIMNCTSVRYLLSGRLQVLPLPKDASLP
jgi:hypothetical protein